MNNKPLPPFAKSLVDRKYGLNKGQVQGRPGYFSWAFLARNILKCPLPTLETWTSGMHTPHKLVQDDMIAKFDRYIEGVNSGKIKRRKLGKSRK